VRAFAAGHRERQLEGVDREGAVDVEISEEDLLRFPHVECFGRGRLARVSVGDVGRGEGLSDRLPGANEFAEGAGPRALEHGGPRDGEQDQNGGDE